VPGHQEEEIKYNTRHISTGKQENSRRAAKETDFAFAVFIRFLVTCPYRTHKTSRESKREARLVKEISGWVIAIER
jgi:hypothetical protein